MHRARMLFLVLLSTAAIPVSAQDRVSAATAESSPLATVDFGYVAERSAAGQQAFRKVADRERMWSVRLDAERRTLIDQQRQLQDPALRDALRGQLERAFQRGRIAFERLEQDAREDVLDLERQVASEFRAMVAPVLDGLARERSIAVVFDRDAPILAWVTPAVDLSEEIVKRLDARP